MSAAHQRRFGVNLASDAQSWVVHPTPNFLGVDATRLFMPGIDKNAVFSRLPLLSLQ